MMESFKHHLFKEFKLCSQTRILVAVSGGIDSIALLHLLKNSGVEVGIAHANFQLRDDESDCDEVFVRDLAKYYELPFYGKRFDTKTFADEQGISMQMAARKLRYQWFNELALEHQWDFISTGHNMDDQIETFFINLLRGTGISGLKGIPAQSGIIIRPLLAFYRSEIEEYIKIKRLNYREDSSNFKTDYLRNRIRHQLIPLLNELRPAFRKVMAGNLSHLAKTETFFKELASELISGIVKNEKSGILISIPKLMHTGHPELLLYQILQDFGFSTAQIQKVYQALDSQPGKTFHTETHRLIKDREHLILQVLTDLDDHNNEFVITEETSEVSIPLHLQFQSFPKDSDFQPMANPDKAFLDFGTIRFPLKIRKWKHGNQFKPLGMKGRMKLSDYFVANKFSITEKENTWLLADVNDQIIWIIGHRIADQNKIRPDTRYVYAIVLIH